MGRPPAYLFVVRHGNRLDAADQRWHLSSPAPYDPPLTYGGWLQSRTVGVRILSMLRQREAEDAEAARAEASVAPGHTARNRRKRRRYKVVVHSSPFLRCVQTAVAICAGLASGPPTEPRSSVMGLPRGRVSSRPNPGTPGTHTRGSTERNIPYASGRVGKTVLRLDAFLGEWLSADYFEHITPPPDSSLMLTVAKAQLMREEDYNSHPHFMIRHVHSIPGQLWDASPARLGHLASHSESASALNNLSGLAERLPRANESPSDSAAQHGYVAPAPFYAMASSAPIPDGYVAHARDVCVDFDFQWDSTREELGWGDGGTLPEEWAAMHQRFRKGLGRLVDWYAKADHPAQLAGRTANIPTPMMPGANIDDNTAVNGFEDDEVVEEDVAVLVSHGAGCNALIGAITQQPVLIDVAMSSLTMAERRPEFDTRLEPPNQSMPRSLDDASARRKLALPEIYDLKITASTEHLRSSLSTPRASRPSSTASLAQKDSRERCGTDAVSALRDINLFPANSRRSSANASLGSMRRYAGGPSQAIRPSSFNTAGVAAGRGIPGPSESTGRNRSLSWGLWAPRMDEEEELAPSPSDLDSGHEKAAQHHNGEASEVRPNTSMEGLSSNGPDESEKMLQPRSADAPDTPQAEGEEDRDKFDENSAPRPRTGTGNGGLWGAPIPPGDAERLRDFTSTKRRWTVNER